MIAIDQLCYCSRLRYEYGEVKFSYAMLTLLVCVVSRQLPVSLTVLAVNYILTVKKGGVPPRRYRHFMAVPLVFLLLSTLAIVVNIGHRPMDLFALPIGSLYLTGSRAGLAYGANLVLTALGSVSCLYFLAMTTPMPDILNTLRKLHCPPLLIELMLLIYRYIFVLLSTAHAIRTSQVSRLGNRDYRRSLRSFGLLGSVLMIRAVTRSKALYDSMEARCYDGVIQVLSETHPARKSSVIKIGIFECLLVLIAIGGTLL